MRIKAVLDRFEEDKAVLLLGDDEVAVAWPRRLLPPEAGEGDIIFMSMGVDVGATREARAEAEDMLRKLLDKNRP